MDRILMLHADHEQNASTSTVRLAGSSGANPFACIAAGIASLWGPSHGGANEAVINMLNEIGGKQNIPGFLSRVKDKQDHTRLMGFGHRVYKNYDPRAKVMRQTCHEVLTSLGINHDPLLELAMEMEQIALKDDYFISKKLYPNVDFYSGIIFRAIGIPTSMFTVLFAVARTVGWISQWNEMIEDPGPEDRPAAPALQRPDRAALQAAAHARLSTQSGRKRGHRKIVAAAPGDDLGGRAKAQAAAARRAARPRRPTTMRAGRTFGPAGAGRIASLICWRSAAGRC